MMLPSLTSGRTDSAPKYDGYIDDALFMAFLIHNQAWEAAILLFMIHLLDHPVHNNEVGACREDLLSL
jgi:hypothetical protein